MGDRYEFFICLWPSQQCLKGPYARFQKKYSVIHEKCRNIYTERQTNRKTETDSLIWLTNPTEVRILNFRMTDWENVGPLLENQNFPRISKDCKYFYFRPFSDKTNDIIFLKSSKSLFCAIFNFLGGIFSVWKSFQQNWDLPLLIHYGPLT